jgi:hypothetical protein
MTENRRFHRETISEPLSPELVLVDPQLANLAREHLRLVGDDAPVESRPVVPANNQGPAQGRADAHAASAESVEALGERLAAAQPGPGSRDDRGTRVAGEMEFSAISPEDADENPLSARASPHMHGVLLPALAVFAVLAAGFSILQFAQGVSDAGENGFRPLTTAIESTPVRRTDARKNRPTNEPPRAGARARTGSPRPTKPAVQPKKRVQPVRPSRFPTRIFVWPAVSGATFYKVEFFRRGRKVFEASPTTPRIELPLRWVFRGQHFRLTPATYRWEVRAAFGPRSRPRYGKLITRSTWTAE